MSFFNKLFRRNTSKLQRSITTITSDSSSDDEDDIRHGSHSAPEAARNQRRTEPQNTLGRTETLGRRTGGEMRRSQTYTESTCLQGSARVSTSSCDSSSFDDRLRQHYGKLKRCHRGKKATILEGTDRTTKRPVVIKAFSKTGMTTSSRDKMEREVAVLKAAAGCTGIVKMLNVIEDVLHNYVVLESIPGCTLIELMAAHGGRISESRCVMEVVYPLLQALATLHSQGIVHRDIKPEHIMCTYGSVKLVDFCESAQQGQQCLNHRVGQLEYMAPEVLSKPSADEIFHQVLFKGMAENELPQYNEKADVWSAGAVIFEALTGQQPFLAEDAREMTTMHATLGVLVGPDGLPTRLDHPRLSPLAKQFLAAALQTSPDMRPSAEQLLQHSWVAKYTGNSASQWLLPQSQATSRVSTSSSFSHQGGLLSMSAPSKVSLDGITNVLSNGAVNVPVR